MELYSQISYDPAFIKGLLDKLKVGNRRGIHLNALPGRHRARLDLKDFDSIKKGMAKDFFDELTSKESFKFTVDFEGVDMTSLTEKQKEKLFLVARKLNNIVIDNNDQYLEFGVKNFSLGYPLLVRRDKADPSKVIKAPLLLWSLTIERSPRKSNCWIISREEGAPVVINELLRSHVANDAQINLQRVPEDVLSDGVVDAKEIQEICFSVLEQLNIRRPTKKATLPKLEGSGTKQKMESLATDDAWICWAGVFGLYRARKEPIIKRAEEMLEDLTDFQEEKLLLEDFQKNTASAVDTDPSKEEIIRSLTKSEFKLIQGPPGTGKSQAVSAIITNTLSSGGRCLVVCEKRTALNVVYKNLEAIGLGNYVALIEDINRDRKDVVKKARSRVDSLRHWHGSSNFNRLHTQYEEIKKQMGARHAALMEKMMGELRWKDVVGLFLRHSKNLDTPEQLLKYDDCKFTSEEYEKLTQRVDEGALLYSVCDIASLGALNKLKKELFKSPYSRSIFDKLTRFTEERVSVLNEIDTTLSSIDAIETKLLEPLVGKSSVDDWIKKTDEALRLLQELVAALKVCPEKTSEEKDGLVKVGYVELVSSLLSQKAKDIRIAKEKYREKAEGFNKLAEQFPKNIDIDSLSVDKELTVVVAKQACSSLVKKIEKVKSALEGVKDLHKAIEKQEGVLVSQRDEWTNYKHLAPLSALQLLSYRQAVQEEKKFFEELKKQLKLFRHFHDWSYFINQLKPFERLVIKKLLPFEPKSWGDIVRAWYLYGLLARVESDVPKSTEEAVGDLVEVIDEMREAQIDSIKHDWDIKAAEAKHKLEHLQGIGFNLLYNLARNRRFSKLSLRQIVDKDFELFTSVFPVLLTSPLVADSILPLEQGLFDVVIFDEASQLRIEDTFTSMIRGKFKIIAGDEHQMPPSSYFEAARTAAVDDDDEEREEGYIDVEGEMARTSSLLDYASNLPDSQKNHSYLDYHYRSRHPALIEFSNAAFYGGNLVSFPETIAYAPIELLQVNGIYEDNQNTKEVLEVIRLLKEEVQADEEGVCPSVGIATFNIKQRNAIIEAIAEESVEDEEFARKFEGIQDAGFFVKNLENIQGDEMDIMIISTTYGKNTEGRFFERFGPINLEKGYKLLNVLITRAKQKVFVCTSVPQSKYRQYAAELEKIGNNRKAILYAYLMYAEAISNHDAEIAKSVLQALLERTHDQPRLQNEHLVESPFEQEVYEILSEVFGEKDFQPQVKVGGFRIDFVISLPNGEKVALECDGKTYHSSNEAYAYDMYRQSELEKMGYQVYRIWSTDWWHSHEEEKEKLLRFVSELNKEHE